MHRTCLGRRQKLMLHMRQCEVRTYQGVVRFSTSPLEERRSHLLFLRGHHPTEGYPRTWSFLRSRKLMLLRFRHLSRKLGLLA